MVREMVRPRTILLSCTVASALVLGWNFFVNDSHDRAGQKKAEAVELERQVKSLERESNLLSKRAQKLKTHSPELEDAVRQELGYIKRDEVILRLDKPAPKADVP